MTGHLIRAQEAEKMRLVNHVVPSSRFSRALAFARELANGPTIAIRPTKMTANRHLW